MNEQLHVLFDLAENINNKLTLDRNDKLWDDWEHLGLAVLEQVKDTLDGKEPVWVLLLTDTLHEDRQVVMIIKLCDLNLPCNPVRRAMLNLDGQISTIVETTELAWWDHSAFHSTGSWGQNSGLLFCLVERADFSTIALAFLSVLHHSGCVGYRLLLGCQRLWLKHWVVLLRHVS